MSTIKLQSLSLLNFKGIRKLTIDSFDQQTNIYGANGSGKTTIFDAFTWLLFGKDSHGNTQFEIKTLDSQNNVIPKIDHEVSAVILVKNEETEIKRTYREKWVKKRGALDAEFSGHETLYYWNDVPVQAKEFSQKIESIMDESLFKLITNPLAFNSMDWRKQRGLLVDISGGVTDSEVAGDDNDLQNLIGELTSKSIDEYKKQIAARRKKANDELKLIPSRIDEVQRSKPIPIDVPLINGEIKKLESGLAEIDAQIENEVKAHQAELDKQKEIQNQIHALKSEISEIEFQAKQDAKQKALSETSTATNLENKLNELKSALNEYESGVSTLQTKLAEKQQNHAEVEKHMSSLRNEWKEINASELTFNDDDFHCPTCKREFESGDVEAKKAEMIANFKVEKKSLLTENQNKGKAKKAVQVSLEEEIKNLEGRILNGQRKVQEATDEVESVLQKLEEEKENTSVIDESTLYADAITRNSDYQNKLAEIQKLENALKNRSEINTDDLKENKQRITSQIKELESKLADDKLIKKADERIQELEKGQRILAQVVADNEKIEYDIERFTKLKIDTLESIINAKFSFVKFKMFETQINGGEVETCKALIDGVPFSDANTASKINAGIDIINTLCEFYKVSAPIFIDNRESVSELLPTDSQVINLYVSEADNKLRIESENKQLATI